MKKLFSAKTLLVSACCILLTSCATTQTQTDEASTESSAIQQQEHPSVAQFSAEDRSQLYFSILLADIASKQQLYDVAQSNFLYAAEQTGSQDLSAKAAMIALIERDYANSIQAIKLWLEVAPEDPNAYKLAVITTLAQGKQQQAENYLQQLLKLLPGNDDEKLYELIQMASFQDDADFVAFYREVNEPLTSPYTAAAEAYLHLKSDKPKEQYDRIQTLLSYTLEQKPEFLSAIELKGEAFALNSKQQRDQYLLQVLDNRNLTIDQTYKIGELLYTQRNYADALVAFERVLDERDDDKQTQFLVASSHYALEHYQRAADIFWYLARQSYKKEITSYYCGDSAARAGDLIKAYTCYEMVPVGRFYQTARTDLAQLYSENNQKQQAIKSLRLAQRKVGLDSRQELLEFEINLLTQTGEFKEAAQRIEAALQVSPDKPFLFYLKLQLLNQTQSVAEFRQSIIDLRNSAEDEQLKTDVTLVGANFLQGRNSHLMAYQLLEEASKQQPDNIDLLYSKALAAEPLEYYSSMEKDLRQVLKLDPDHVHAKNSLGYTLADLNRSLDEAKRLIESAYHLEPDNVAIQDSMGWVNYRLGNYEEALKYLEMAYERDASPEIASHLGEVLWVMEKQQRAIKVWQKALRLSPNNQYILRTLRRFPEANVSGK